MYRFLTRLVVLLLLAAPAHALDVPFDTTGVGTSSGATVRDLTRADMDLDGDLDFVGAYWNSDAVYWIENDAGDGTSWTTNTIVSNLNAPLAVATAPILGTTPDVLVTTADYAGGNVLLYLNFGANFLPVTLDSGLDNADYITTGDINSDGKLDVIVSAYWDQAIYVYLQPMSPLLTWPRFQAATSFQSSNEVAAGDLDGDGDLDLVGVSYSEGLTWFENSGGSGTLWIETPINAAAEGSEVEVGDFDNDGQIDVAVAGNYPDTVELHLNDGAAASFTQVFVDTNYSAVELGASDLDDDGDLDLVAMSNNDEVRWYENLLGTGLVWNVTDVSDSALYDPDGLVLGDVDGDGDTDFAMNHLNSGGPTQEEWYGNLGNHKRAGLAGTTDASTSLSQIRDLATGDIDGDGDPDVVGAAYNAGLIWWDGVPGGSWTPTTIDASWGTAVGVAVGDLDGDGDLDVAATSYSSDDVGWFQNNGGGSWTSYIIDGSVNGAQDIAIGDVNGDGNLDVVATAYIAGDVLWWSGSGSSWTKTYIESSLSGARGVDLGDWDGDGDLDVAVAGSIADEVIVYENGSAGTTWTPSVISSAYDAPTDVVFADMEPDGDLDLFVSWYDDDRLSLFHQTSGGVQMATLSNTVPGIWALDAADVDHDGDVDVFATARDGDQVLFFETTDTALILHDQTVLDASYDSPYALALGDFDLDGTADLAAGGTDSAELRILELENAHASVVGTATSPAVPWSGLDDIFAFSLEHLGRTGDQGLIAEEIQIEMTSGGVPLTQGQVNTIFDAFYFVRDNNGNLDYDLGTDFNLGVDLIPSVDSSGVVTLNLPSFAVTAFTGQTETYLVVPMLDSPESAGLYDVDMTLLSGSTTVFDHTYWTTQLWSRGDGDASATLQLQLEPTADAGGPYTTDEGVAVTIDASGSTDPDGNIDTYTYNCGDGGSITFSSSSTRACTYEDDGTYTVTVSVIDDQGLVSPNATATVTVSNVAPVADAGSAVTGSEMSAVTVSGGATDTAPDLAAMTYTWDWGDGTSEVGTATDTHTYSDDGVYTITLTVDDGDGGSDSDTTTATIANVAPTNVDAGSTVVDTEGDSVQFCGSATEVSPLDTMSYTWDWGDGNTTGPITSACTSHTWLDNNASGWFTVTLTVSDEDGGSATDTAQVAIGNVVPQITSSAPTTAAEGTTWTYTPTIYDPGTLDTFTFAFSANDPGLVESPAGTFTFTPTYAHVGASPLSVTLAVNDDDSPQTDTESWTITVTPLDVDADGMDDGWELANGLDPTDLNDAGDDPDNDGINNLDEFLGGTDPNVYDGVGTPVADAGGPYSADEGDTVLIDVTGSSDPNGTVDLYELDCDGDGTPDVSTALTTATLCSWADDGTFTVTLTVTDDGGLTATATATATVDNVAPVFTTTPPTTASDGVTYTYTPGVTDAGVLDGASWSLASGPAGMTETNGVLEWTPTYADALAGIAAVELEASDGDGGVATQMWTIFLTPADADADGMDDAWETTNGLDPTDLNDAGDDPDNDGISNLDEFLGGTDPNVYDGVGTPVADAGGPYTADEGDSVLIDVTASSDPNGTIDLYELDCDGDGTPDVSTALSSATLCSWADDGTYTITLTVTDDGGLFATATATVTVANVAPVFATTPPTTASDGVTYTYAAGVTDAGVLDGVSWSLNTAPSGMTETSGALSWTPTYADALAGTAAVELEASDGDGGIVTQSWAIVVTPTDSDGDGMDDAWETANGLDPTLDDSADDPDADGVPNGDEFLAGTDPLSSDGPGAPVAIAPVGGVEVASSPDFEWTTSVDPNGDSVEYELEVYEDASLTQMLLQVTGITDDPSLATQVVNTAYAFAENTTPAWRVRSLDPYTESTWTSLESFFMNGVEEAPSTPATASPLTGDLVSVLTPTLTWTEAIDPDGDDVTYDVELLDAAGALVDSGTAVAGLTWTGTVTVTDDVDHSWRVRAVDEHGTTGAWSAEEDFFVSTSDDPPGLPTFLSPLDGDAITEVAPAVSVTETTDPEGDAITYQFEADTVSSFDSADLLAEDVPDSGTGTAVWDLAGSGLSLIENTTWFLRVRAQDALGAASDWETITLFVRGPNDPPDAPVLLEPFDGTSFEVAPALVAAHVTDPEGDDVSYDFVLAEDAALSVVVEQALGLAPGAGPEGTSDQVSWQPASLAPGDYYWAVTATDDLGDSATSAAWLLTIAEPATGDDDDSAGDDDDSAGDDDDSAGDDDDSAGDDDDSTGDDDDSTGDDDDATGDDDDATGDDDDSTGDDDDGPDPGCSCEGNVAGSSASGLALLLTLLLVPALRRRR